MRSRFALHIFTSIVSSLPRNISCIISSLRDMDAGLQSGLFLRGQRFRTKRGARRSIDHQLYIKIVIRQPNQIFG